ncbi:MAG: heparinase II/III family protein [Acidimicrobiales bacterium]
MPGDLDDPASLDEAFAASGADTLAILASLGFGHAVVRTGAGRLHLVADAGPPCPSELPAHSHADCLSFEFAVDGRRLIVDTGTSTYRAGPRRDQERSTAAHNTVEIDGEGPSHFWSRRTVRPTAP